MQRFALELSDNCRYIVVNVLSIARHRNQTHHQGFEFYLVLVSLTDRLWFSSGSMTVWFEFGQSDSWISLVWFIDIRIHPCMIRFEFSVYGSGLVRFLSVL